MTAQIEADDRDADAYVFNSILAVTMSREREKPAFGALNSLATTSVSVPDATHRAVLTAVWDELFKGIK